MSEAPSQSMASSWPQTPMAPADPARTPELTQTDVMSPALESVPETQPLEATQDTVVESQDGDEHGDDASALGPPCDLSHHLSRATRRRTDNSFKKLYRFFLRPGMRNLAAGMPNPRFFPIDALEAQAALPDRWAPTPNNPPAPTSPPSRPSSSSSSSRGAPLPPRSPTHSSQRVVVPHTSSDPNPLSRIDVDTALEYGLAQGYPPLLSFLRQFVRETLHPGVPYAGGPDVILTCGATEGIHHVLELLVDEWISGRDPIETKPWMLVEKFMYSAAADQASARGVGVVPVEIDPQGLMARGKGGLAHVLASWDDKNGPRPRFLYAVTMGHNPTGGVLSLARRRELYAICKTYDVIIIEDDPYWHLQYPSAAGAEAASRIFPVPPESPAGQYPEDSLDDSPFVSAGADPLPEVPPTGDPFIDSLVPSFLRIDTDGRVIRLDTFSKTVAPGCRLGWITAQPAFITHLIRISEATSQQPSGFVQSLIASLIMGSQPASSKNFFSLPLLRRSRFRGWDTTGWIRWLSGLRGEYERRMTRMCTILEAGTHQLKHGTPMSKSLSDWGVVTKTRILSFHWPRGGMFVWVRLHFDAHPLWMTGMADDANGRDSLINGPAISAAMVQFLTQEPHSVIVVPGFVFSATSDVQQKEGWAYFRLCFAAEDDDKLDASTVRFVKGIHQFWRIKDKQVISTLLDKWHSESTAQADETTPASGVVNLSLGFGC